MKCKFWNDCEWYDEDSEACKNKGLYFSDDGICKMKTASCYNRMEKKCQTAK